MNTRFIFNRFVSCQKAVRPLLIAFWCIGLLCGILLSVSLHEEFTNAFSLVLQKRPIALYRMLSIIVPVVFLVAVHNQRCVLLCCAYIFFEAVCRGFSGMAVFCVFGSGAWLLRFLLLFSAIFRATVVWLLVFLDALSKKIIYYTVSIGLIVSLIDFLFISPQLIHLSTYI